MREGGGLRRVGLLGFYKGKVQEKIIQVGNMLESIEKGV